MHHQMMQGIIQHRGFHAGKIPLKHQRILFLWRLGLINLRLRPQIVLRILAPGFEQISGHGVELGRVGGHDEVLQEEIVKVGGKEPFSLL